ncbi:MAG: hypothetical protein AB7E77_10240 [Desulfobulbus sp.]
MAQESLDNFSFCHRRHRTSPLYKNKFAAPFISSRSALWFLFRKVMVIPSANGLRRFFEPEPRAFTRASVSLLVTFRFTLAVSKNDKQRRWRAAKRPEGRRDTRQQKGNCRCKGVKPGSPSVMPGISPSRIQENPLRSTIMGDRAGKKAKDKSKKQHDEKLKHKEEERQHRQPQKKE